MGLLQRADQQRVQQQPSECTLYQGFHNSYRQHGYLNAQGKYYAIEYDDYGRVLKECLTTTGSVTTIHNALYNATVEESIDR